MRAQFTNGVTRHGRGERPVISQWRLSGFTVAGVTARRSAGCSGVGSFSRSGSANRSLDRAVQHANGAVAPDRLVRSCHRGARLICNVGRTKKTKTPIIFRQKKTHRASPGVGGRCSRSEFVSHDMALSGGGAAIIGLLGRQGQVAGRAVGVGHALNRSPGHVDPDDADSAIGAPSRSGNAGDSIRRGSVAGPLCGLNRRTGSRGTFAVNGC